MCKTQALATIVVVAIVLLHTPVWGQSTPEMRALGAMVTTAAPVELTAGRVTVRIAMRGDARAQVEAAMAPSSRTGLALTVEEIVYKPVVYEVYINLPKGETANYKSVYFVGSLAPFLPRAALREQPYIASFDITRNVRELKSLNVWNDAELSVTFVMRGLVDGDGRELPVPPGVRGRVSNVTVAAFTPQ